MTDPPSWRRARADKFFLELFEREEKALLAEGMRPPPPPEPGVDPLIRFGAKDAASRGGSIGIPRPLLATEATLRATHFVEGAHKVMVRLEPETRQKLFVDTLELGRAIEDWDDGLRQKLWGDKNALDNIEKLVQLDPRLSMLAAVFIGRSLAAWFSQHGNLNRFEHGGGLSDAERMASVLLPDKKRNGFRLLLDTPKVMEARYLSQRPASS